MNNFLLIQNRSQRRRFGLFVVILILALFLFVWKTGDVKLAEISFFLLLLIIWPALNLFNIYKYKQGWGISGGGTLGGYFVGPDKATNKQRKLLLQSSLIQLGFYILALIFLAWLWLSGSVRF